MSHSSKQIKLIGGKRLPNVDTGLRSQRVAMVVFSHYPQNARVRRQAETLFEAAMEVDIICLRDEREKAWDRLAGVGVHRINLRRKHGRIIRHLFEYAAFFMLAMFRLNRLHFRKKYDVVLVQNMPDFLVLTAFYPKRTGARIILDMPEAAPEVFMTKYDWQRAHGSIRGLIRIERHAIRFAHTVLTPNTALRELLVTRGCPREKIHIVMNAPDEKIFSRRLIMPRTSQKRFVILYHGAIVERHGLDIAVRAIALLREDIPGIEFHVYGQGESLPDFLRLVERLSLKRIVRYKGVISLDRIAKVVSGIDLGIIPNKATPLTSVNFPTQIFEYLSLNKPLIVPRTRGILDYFADDALFFFEPGDVHDLAHAIEHVYRNPMDVMEVMRKATAVYRQHRWELSKRTFVDIVRGLPVRIQLPAARRSSGITT